MPVSPHPVTFTVYDTDGTTLLASANCVVRNCTKKSTSSVTQTNSSGIAIIDLANLDVSDGQTNEYDVGDVCLLIAYKDTDVGKSHVAARYVVAGESKSKTLYLNPFPYMINDEFGATSRIYSMTFANTDGTNAGNVKVYSFDDCELLRQVRLAANATHSIYFGPRGIQGRMVLEISDVDIVVTGNIR